MRQRAINKKGSYFFVLDAFIAGLVIMSSIAILYNAASARQSPVQSFLLAEDFATFLADTELKAYTGEAVYNMTRNGAITNEELTLLQQIVIFYHPIRKWDEDDMKKSWQWRNMTLLINEVSGNAPDNTGLGFWIQESTGPQVLLGEKSVVNIIEKDSRTMLSAQRIVAVPDGNTLIGPYVVEVRLWR